MSAPSGPNCDIAPREEGVTAPPTPSTDHKQVAAEKPRVDHDDATHLTPSEQATSVTTVQPSHSTSRDPAIFLTQDMLSAVASRVGSVTEASAMTAAPDGRPLTELTRDELLELVEAQQAGIKIYFPGKDVARQLARRVRPRVSRTIAKYGVGDAEEQARNSVIEGDNLQAMISLYR